MTTLGRRPRVLVVAYACDPTRGSEDGVGWGWIRALARFADVHVLTAAHQSASLRGHAADAGLDVNALHFVPHRAWHYRPTPRWLRIENSGLKPLMNLAYTAWQGDALRVARGLHAAAPFDLVHLVTYVGFRFPGRFWRLGTPFVWGPVGGLENTPWRFLSALGGRGALYYGMRNLVNSLQKRVLRGPRLAFRRASAVLAATRGIRAEIRRRYRVDAEVLCEIGVPDLPGDLARGRADGEPLRLSWSGEHLPGKALPLLLGALATLDDGVDWRLDVMGSGPLTAAWKEEAETRGIASRIRWTGWIPREEALSTLRDSHVFVITSLKDLTSTVVLEALGSGVPVVCPDHCGFSDVVDDTCGVKIPVTTIESFCRDLASALRRLAGDESGRRRLAAGAYERSRSFTWARKSQYLQALYRRVLRREGPL